MAIDYISEKLRGLAGCFIPLLSTNGSAFFSKVCNGNVEKIPTRIANDEVMLIIVSP
jgi:hypothetical protein